MKKIYFVFLFLFVYVKCLEYELNRFKTLSLTSIYSYTIEKESVLFLDSIDGRGYAKERNNGRRMDDCFIFLPKNYNLQLLFDFYDKSPSIWIRYLFPYD